MLGICVLHCITLGTKRAHPLAGLLMCCVPGFVFISGWFGIKFVPSKVLRLFGVGLFCSVVAVGINFLLGIAPSADTYWKQVVALWANGFWFLNAYIALMMLAPLVDVVVSLKDIGKMISYLLPLLILVFGWSYVCGSPVIHKLPWPQTAGMGSNTALTLLGVYAFGRICRVMRVDERLTIMHLLIVALICVPLVMIGFGNYHSIFSSVLAMAAFVWVSRMNMPKWLSRIILFVAPSMFSVYLMHSTKYGFDLIEMLQDRVQLPLVLNAIVMGVIVFLFCVAVDFVRRIILLVIDLKVVYSSFDNFYSKIIEHCGKRFS